MSKVFAIDLLFLYFALWLVCFSFTLRCDRSRKLAPLSQQSDTKLKPLATWSSAFCRALGSLYIYIYIYFFFSSHWLLNVFPFLLIGRCNSFGFLRHSVEKYSMKRTHYLGYFHQSWVHVLQWDLTRSNVVAIKMGREMTSNWSARFSYKNHWKYFDQNSERSSLHTCEVIVIINAVVKPNYSNDSIQRWFYLYRISFRAEPHY